MKTAMSELTADAIARDLGTEVVGCVVEYRAEVASTMDVARAAARDGVADGWAIVADVQTTGRGRFGRRWVTPPGVSIAVSVVLRPNERERCWLSPLAALAAARAIEAEIGLPAALKWPNDVLVNDRKVGGVLVEADGDSAIVGIGINVNLDPAAHVETAGASSLSAEAGAPVSRLAVLRRLLQEMDGLWLRLRRGDAIGAEWAARLQTLGQAVEVKTGSVVVVGVAEAVDEVGALLVRDATGHRHRFLAGEVTMRR